MSWAILVLGIGIGVWAFGVFLFKHADAPVSRKYIYYILKEGNTLFRGKDGQFDPKKLYILVLGEFGAAALFGLAMGALGTFNDGLMTAGATLAGAGLVHLLRGVLSAQKCRKNRVRQIEARAKWKGQGIPTFTPKIADGEYYHGYFGWIRAKTVSALRADLERWLALPDDQAWPDRTYHPGT